MGDKINDGGPAFPCEGGPESGLYPDSGMSLRDWLAGLAMQAMMSGDSRTLATTFEIATSTGVDVETYVARASFAVADAMLKAREAANGDH